MPGGAGLPPRPDPSAKLLDLDAARAWRRRAAAPVVFTNGVFDVLHRGHVALLVAARAEGGALVVGLNSDVSVRRIKGPERPLNSERDRAYVLGALWCVDAVVLFDDDTPARLVAALEPDVLVKGADYAPDEIVGADVVTARGGRVVRIPLEPGYSTTGLIARMKGGAG